MHANVTEVFNLIHTPWRHAHIYGSVELKIVLQLRYIRTASSESGTHDLQFPKFSMPWHLDQLPFPLPSVGWPTPGTWKSVIGDFSGEIWGSDCLQMRFPFPLKKKVNQDLFSSISISHHARWILLSSSSQAMHAWHAIWSKSGQTAIYMKSPTAGSVWTIVD
jgi:hypothetical protein